MFYVILFLTYIRVPLLLFTNRDQIQMLRNYTNRQGGDSNTSLPSEQNRLLYFRIILAEAPGGLDILHVVIKKCLRWPFALAYMGASLQQHFGRGLLLWDSPVAGLGDHIIQRHDNV